MKELLKKLETRKERLTKEFEKVYNDLQVENDMKEITKLSRKNSELFGRIDEINNVIISILMEL